MYLDKQSAQKAPPKEALRYSTVRSFEGGLNVADTDLNMAPKYAKVLDNIERSTDGSLSVRPGTVLYCNTLHSLTAIVNHTYFAAHIIAVQADGTFNLIDGDGVCTEMLLSGGKPWAPGFTEVNFTVFNSDLIAVNGRDKPIIIAGRPTDPNFLAAQFLVDLATLSNINTPIGKYVIAHAQYTLIAGVPTDPSTLFISARGTSGTFFADPDPNDAVNLDLGPRVSLGSASITGMVAYRDKLLVTFERGVLPLNLGVYTGSPSVHTPTDDGFIEEFGCLCHRSLVSVGDDTFFNDNVGVNSISRVNVFNTLRPVRASHLIDPLTTALIQPLTVAQIAQYMFAVYDLRNFRYMLFIPQFDAAGNLVETIGFSYTNIPTLKVQAWARLRGWKWQSACRTALQNIIFAQGNKLYSYDFDSDRALDFQDDPAINGGKGVGITFEWELPWADFKQRMEVKFMRYIAMDTQGSGVFTLQAYVDNIQSNPLLSIPFLNGGGFGNSPFGDSPFGGGRTTIDERLLAFVAKFKILKLRMFGTTKTPLRFVSVSIAYLMGSIRR